MTGRYRRLELQAGDPLDLELRAGLALPFGGTTARPQVDLQYVPFGQQKDRPPSTARATFSLSVARDLAL